MTLRSLSASVSCLMVASWGPAESWGDGLRSEEFISCRLRQNAATCSVLFRAQLKRQDRRSYPSLERPLWHLSLLKMFLLVNELPHVNHISRFPKLLHASESSLNAHDNHNNNCWHILNDHCLPGTGLIHLILPLGKWGLLSFLFYSWDNRGQERLSNSSKIAQLGSEPGSMAQSLCP